MKTYKKESPFWKKEEGVTFIGQSTLGFVWETQKAQSGRLWWERGRWGEKGEAEGLKVISSVEERPGKVLGRNTWGPGSSANEEAEPALNVPFQSITTLQSEQFILKISSIYSDNRNAAGIIVLQGN